MVLRRLHSVDSSAQCSELRLPNSGLIKCLGIGFFSQASKSGEQSLRTASHHKLYWWNSRTTLMIHPYLSSTKRPNTGEISHRPGLSLQVFGLSIYPVMCRLYIFKADWLLRAGCNFDIQDIHRRFPEPPALQSLASFVLKRRHRSRRRVKSRWLSSINAYLCHTKLGWERRFASSTSGQTAICLLRRIMDEPLSHTDVPFCAIRTII